MLLERLKFRNNLYIANIIEFKCFTFIQMTLKLNNKEKFKF